jgi:type III secretion protein R
MDILPAYFTGIVAVLLLSSFVKILTTLTIVRYGIGLNGASFGFVVVALGFVLSLIVVNAQAPRSGGLAALISAKAASSAGELEENFGPFLDRHSQPEIKARLSAIAHKLKAPKDGVAETPGALRGTEFPVLIAAFLLSELKEAFQLGFIILVPFLVIDLLVVNALMALGITQMSPFIVSFPLKILLFFAVDGWTLLSEKLLRAYL